MAQVQMQSREEVIAEMRATGKYAEPKAGEPTLGYLGDLGHRYARPEELTKEALFSLDPVEPLVQTPEMKQRADELEQRLRQEAKYAPLQRLATRITSLFKPETITRMGKGPKP